MYRGFSCPRLLNRMIPLKGETLRKTESLTLNSSGHLLLSAYDFCQFYADFILACILLTAFVVFLTNSDAVIVTLPVSYQ